MESRMRRLGSGLSQGTRSTAPCTRSTMRRSLALVLLGCCVAIRFLACSSPVDQTWIPGIYDIADYDDVIGMLTDVTAVEESLPVTVERPDVVYWSLHSRRASGISSLCPFCFSSRSPPNA